MRLIRILMLAIALTLTAAGSGWAACGTCCLEKTMDCCPDSAGKHAPCMNDCNASASVALPDISPAGEPASVPARRAPHHTLALRGAMPDIELPPPRCA